MCIMGAHEQQPSLPGRPVGWYCHIPFCAGKCRYCDFYSIPLATDLLGDFVRAIRREISTRDPHRPVDSIFVGGGTPTILPADALGGLLDEIVARTGQVAEFSVEANPAGADELKLDLLRNHGVNRLSLGAQSFDPRELAFLARLHGPADIPRSIAAARAAGFANISLDLIYAIPGQTLNRWRDTIRQAIDFAPEHLSCYALTYEPGTPLARLREQGAVTACDENLEADMFELTIDDLTAAGFEHYEISNFARPGRRCQANMIYWQNREYFGVGPAAVSYLDGTRRKNLPDVRRYIAAMESDPAGIVAEEEKLPEDARTCETAIQMLRLIEGIDIETFRRRTGHDPRAFFSPAIERLSADGLLETTPASIRLTRRGLLLANRVMAEFLPPARHSP